MVYKTHQSMFEHTYCILPKEKWENGEWVIKISELQGMGNCFGKF